MPHLAIRNTVNKFGATMHRKIRAQLINYFKGDVIREHFFDEKNETLESVLQRIERYVTLENLNKDFPIRIKVDYSGRSQ